MDDLQRTFADEMNRMAEREQRKIFGLTPEPTEGAGVLDRERLKQMLSLTLGKPAGDPVPEGKEFAPGPIAEIKMVGGWSAWIGSGPDDMHPLPPGMLKSLTVEVLNPPEEIVGLLGLSVSVKAKPISISFPLTVCGDALKGHVIERVEIKTVSAPPLPRWYAPDPRCFIPRNPRRRDHQLAVKASRRKRRNRR